MSTHLRTLALALVDTASVTGTQATFAHWFQTTGTFTQTAYVTSMGSSATCTAQTVVW